MLTLRRLPNRIALFSAFLALTLLFSAQCAMAHLDHKAQVKPLSPVVAPHDHQHAQPHEQSPAKPDCCDEDSLDCCEDLKATTNKAELKPAQGPLVLVSRPLTLLLRPRLVASSVWRDKGPPSPALTPVSLKQVNLN